MSEQSLIERLARPELLTMVPYQSARRIGGCGDIWLNANESPFSDTKPSYNRYPEFQPVELIENYARYANVANDQVLASRGADEAIELLIRTFCNPGQDKITICTPTYGMYAISAATCNVGINKVPLTSDWQLDPQLCNKVDDSKILFICNPNNPTGSTLSIAQLEPIVKQLQETCLVVIDEAYIEFSSDLSMAPLLEKYNNLVVLRTLSKAFALAGLRCGFMLAQNDIIDLVKKVIAPYPIPAPVGIIAEQSLSSAGVKIMSSRVAQLNKLKEMFSQALSTLNGVSAVYDSGANFVLVRFCDNTWFTAIADDGIVVRDQSGVATLEHCLRFSIGSAIEMARLTDTLRKISAQFAA